MPKYLQPAPPKWATDATYPAGSSLWSGLATRIAPPAPQIGFAPNTQPPAEWMNWILGGAGDALDVNAKVQAHGALQAWSLSSPYTTGFSGLRTPVMVGLRPDHGFGTTAAARLPFIVGEGTTSSGAAKLLRSNGGMLYTTSVDISPTYLHPDDAFAGQPGTLVIHQTTSSDFLWSANHGYTWTRDTSLANPIYGGHWASLTAGSAYLLVNLGGTVYRIVTLGGSHTSPTLPSVGTGITGGSVTIADDGQSNIVICARRNGNAYGSLWRSTDVGATWTLIQDLNGPGAVVYSAAWGRFVACDTTGTWTSTDGATWVFASGGFSVAQGANFDGHSMVAVGPAIVRRWLIVVSGTSGALFHDGIGYSLDLGASWNFVGLNAATPSIDGIYSFNGRVYVLNGNGSQVLTSGRLSAPDAEL